MLGHKHCCGILCVHLCPVYHRILQKGAECYLQKYGRMYLSIISNFKDKPETNTLKRTPSGAFILHAFVYLSHLQFSLLGETLRLKHIAETKNKNCAVSVNSVKLGTFGH